MRKGGVFDVALFRRPLGEFAFMVVRQRDQPGVEVSGVDDAEIGDDERTEGDVVEDDEGGSEAGTVAGGAELVDYIVRWWLVELGARGGP